MALGKTIADTFTCNESELLLASLDVRLQRAPNRSIFIYTQVLRIIE